MNVSLIAAHINDLKVILNLLNIKFASNIIASFCHCLLKGLVENPQNIINYFKFFYQI